MKFVLFAAFILIYLPGFSQKNFDLYVAAFYKNYDEQNFEKALEIADKGAKAFPDSIVFWGRRGQMHAHFNNHEQAVEDYNKAFELGETIPELYLLRAVSYQNLKLFDEAAADYKHLEELGEFEETVHAFFGQIEFDRGNYDHAIDLILPNFGTQFDFPRKEYALIDSYFIKEECDSVITYASKLIKLDSTQIRAYAIRGECYRQLDMMFEACEDFLVVFTAGNYDYKAHFDNNDCMDILKMREPNSPYSYPPPPPVAAPVGKRD